MTNVDISTTTAEQRAQIIREERDRLAGLWQHWGVSHTWQVIDWMNGRCDALGVPTMTGDTTEGA